MCFDKIITFFSNLTKKNCFVAVLLVGIAVFFYMQFIYEGFDSVDGCILTTKGLESARGIEKKLKQLKTVTTKDQINVGLNLRDIQTRDIILGDDKKSWCADLSKEDQDKVAKAVSDMEGTEVYLFNGPELMEKLESDDRDFGLEYAGTDDLDTKLSRV